MTENAVFQDEFAILNSAIAEFGKYFGMDTICAIATPMGIGSIGVIRVSGDKAISIADRIIKNRSSLETVTTFKSHTLHHVEMIDPATGQMLDEALVVVMRAPRSYTGEDVVEIQSHGNPHALQKILLALISSGARLAEPGEFTRRAFLSGRIDLAQAEAVMEVISAQSDRAREWALSQLRGDLSREITRLQDAILSILSSIEASIDFTEQGIDRSDSQMLAKQIERQHQAVCRLLAGYDEGRQIREGCKAAIIGFPNVGKSSIMNRLLGEDRAIVTPIPGTTRDTVSEWLSLEGCLIQITDTAGFQTTTDPIEQEGIRRSDAAIATAELILFVCDASRPFGKEAIALGNRLHDKKKIIVLNKSDLPPAVDIHAIRACYPDDPVLACSAATGEGFPDLKKQMIVLISSPIMGSGQDRPLVALLRHKDALAKSAEALQRAGQAAGNEAPVECIAADLREALNALGDIVGETTTDDVLNRIFSRFCIGK